LSAFSLKHILATNFKAFRLATFAEGAFGSGLDRVGSELVLCSHASQLFDMGARAVVGRLVHTYVGALTRLGNPGGEGRTAASSVHAILAWRIQREAVSGLAHVLLGHGALDISEQDLAIDGLWLSSHNRSPLIAK